ncbi:MAG: zf-TFIIB domain-containing protein [Proteobacteria bacterium]|nr:zf-TFIIB domain-containing protein [Pseudomonadota bacterium]
MECPKCKGEMETKRHEEISIDRCNNCYGLLVEERMLSKMLDGWMTESFLDIGTAALGKKYDKIDDIECPYCHFTMDKIVDPEQTHIWMESCPSCYRIFLDAGEFSDLKYKTLSDVFKSLLKGKRKLEA